MYILKYLDDQRVLVKKRPLVSKLGFRLAHSSTESIEPRHIARGSSRWLTGWGPSDLIPGRSPAVHRVKVRVPCAAREPMKSRSRLSLFFSLSLSRTRYIHVYSRSQTRGGARVKSPVGEHHKRAQCGALLTGSFPSALALRLLLHLSYFSTPIYSARTLYAYTTACHFSSRPALLPRRYVQYMSVLYVYEFSLLYHRFYLL